MIQINLLPWRERRREALQRTFVMQIVFAVVISIFIVMVANKTLARHLSLQGAVNRALEQHIAGLEVSVAEVGLLREQQAAIRDRMRVIANLQKERASLVRVFDELVRSLPSEVYFLALERAEDRIFIEGVSESYAGITELMRRLEGSEVFDSAGLNDIAREASEPSSESSLFIFNLSVELAAVVGGSAMASLGAGSVSDE